MPDEDERQLNLKEIEEGKNIDELFSRTIDFREKVLVALATIQTTLNTHIQTNDEFVKESTKDRAELKTCVQKIPDIEKGLNNHLKTHDTVKKMVMYPIIILLISGFGALLWQAILHVLPK